MAYTPTNNPYMPGDPYSYDLNWIIAELKKAITLYEPLSSDFADLKSYVMNYFNNLDVTEEINAKLDEMAADGTFDALLLPYFNSYKSEIDEEILGQNAEIEVLSARMDTFSQLAEGSTTGDAELMDIRIGANGITYPTAGDAVREQFKNVSLYLNDIVPNINQYALTRNTEWTSGKYINPVDGLLANNATYSVTDYILITPETIYNLTRNNQVYGAFYDANKDFIIKILKDNLGAHFEQVTAPAGATYVRLSCPTANIPDLDFSIHASKTLANDIYIPNEPKHIISVAKDGSKDFTSLRAALESIVDSSISNDYRVDFYGDGSEYDIAAEYSAGEIAAGPGLTIPPYVTLRGIGGIEKCIIVGRLTAGTANRYFSAINLSTGASLEGLTVIGEYTRNVVHQDFGTLTDVKSVIKDCYLQGSNLFLAYVLAAGILSGSNYYYENVTFENLTAGGYDYSCHNNVSFINSAFLHFDNCRFKVNAGTTDFAFRLGSINTGANGINCKCILKGCAIPVELRLNQENASAYGPGILWKVSGYANDIAQVRIYTSDGIDYSGNIDLI